MILLIIFINVEDHDIRHGIETAEIVFISLYSAEIVLKLIGYGIRNYFSDNWRVLDFILIGISWKIEVSLVIARFISKCFYPKFSIRNPVKKRKSNKMKSAFYQALEKLYMIALLSLIIESVSAVRRYMQKVITVMPAIFKLLVIMVVSLYCYSIVGMEVFNSQHAVEHESKYLEHQYSTFDNVLGSMLYLFQIVADQLWTDIFFDLMARYELNFTLVSIYFNSFHTVNNIIIVSLIQGMIWEVFALIDKNIQQQEKLKEEIEQNKQKYSEKEKDKMTTNNKHSSKNSLIPNPEMDTILLKKEYYKKECGKQLTIARSIKRSYSLGETQFYLANASTKFDFEQFRKQNKAHEGSFNKDNSKKTKDDDIFSDYSPMDPFAKSSSTKQLLKAADEYAINYTVNDIERERFETYNSQKPNLEGQLPPMIHSIPNNQRHLKIKNSSSHLEEELKSSFKIQKSKCDLTLGQTLICLQKSGSFSYDVKYSEEEKSYYKKRMKLLREVLESERKVRDIERARSNSAAKDDSYDLQTCISHYRQIKPNEEDEDNLELHQQRQEILKSMIVKSSFHN